MLLGFGDASAPAQGLGHAVLHAGVVAVTADRKLGR
jgi:hypothetical protein